MYVVDPISGTIDSGECLKILGKYFFLDSERRHVHAKTLYT